jgi:nitrite reductase (NADH) large subunit
MVGQRLVAELRARDTRRHWRVTVLSQEPRRAYDRVNLSSYFDGVAAEELDLVPDDCYGVGGCELRLGESVTAIDRAARTVRTSSGDVLGYDALVLATGSYAFVPPVPGADLPGCFAYRTLDDLDAIRSAAQRAAAHTPGRRAGLVVGGGLLGLEAARALRLLGMSPHVVERAERHALAGHIGAPDRQGRDAAARHLGRRHRA